jgi:hypothetical protein
MEVKSISNSRYVKSRRALDRYIHRSVNRQIWMPRNIRISEVGDVKEVVTWKSQVTKSQFAKGESRPLDLEGMCLNGSGDP